MGEMRLQAIPVKALAEAVADNCAMLNALYPFCKCAESNQILNSTCRLMADDSGETRTCCVLVGFTGAGLPACAGTALRTGVHDCRFRRFCTAEEEPRFVDGADKLRPLPGIGDGTQMQCSFCLLTPSAVS